MVAIDQKDMDEMLPTADNKAVRAEVEAWTKGAKKIYESTAEDIEKAARISVVLDSLIRQHQADGLAIGTCMGWLQRGFPCLGFTRLRDRGVPAACEGDMDSLLTMVLFQHAIDRPGFQGNATFDTARNALWIAGRSSWFRSFISGRAGFLCRATRGTAHGRDRRSAEDHVNAGERADRPDPGHWELPPNHDAEREGDYSAEQRPTPALYRSQAECPNDLEDSIDENEELGRLLAK